MARCVEGFKSALAHRNLQRIGINTLNWLQNPNFVAFRSIAPIRRSNRSGLHFCGPWHAGAGSAEDGWGMDR